MERQKEKMRENERRSEKNIHFRRKTILNGM